MKHRGFKVICLIIWACITVFPGFSDENTVDYKSIVLESFRGDGDLIWKTQASRFASPVRDPNNRNQVVTDDDGNITYFPLTTYVNAWPTAAFGNFRGNDSQNQIMSFGIHGRFDRTGYNWIDIYPVLADDPDERPYEIDIPGRILNMDMWVWGSNHRFYIEVFLRDYRGVVHSLRLGDLAYIGWRNLSVNIPSTIAQSRRTLPALQALKFVKFRIWTTPSERVDNFYVYFNQLKIWTDMFESLYDGNELADPAEIERLWSGN